jgi:hypothetical protein
MTGRKVSLRLALALLVVGGCAGEIDPALGPNGTGVVADPSLSDSSDVDGGFSSSSE